jgi:hypothetical protein
VESDIRVGDCIVLVLLLFLWLRLAAGGGPRDFALVRFLRPIARSMFGVAVVLAAALVGGVFFAVVPHQGEGRLDTHETIAGATCILAVTCAGGAWLRTSMRELVVSVVVLLCVVFVLIGMGTGPDLSLFCEWFRFLGAFIVAPHFLGALLLMVFSLRKRPDRVPGT